MPIQKQPACCRRQTVGGHEQLIIETAAGQRITLTDGTGSIQLEDTSGNSIQMENGKVTVNSPGKLVLQAALIELDGSVVQINAATVQCSGVVKCDTIEATNVVASNYTPGAGNVW
jgi:uncharacterized protein (DUF2345 family)